MLAPKSTFLIPSGPKHDPGRNHLHIVIARKAGPPSQLLLVSVCTIEGGPYDDTVVLNAGDHSFIQHPSYVNYRFARIEAEERILGGLETKEFTERDDCTDELLATLIYGLRESPQAKPFGKTFQYEAD